MTASDARPVAPWVALACGSVAAITGDVSGALACAALVAWSGWGAYLEHAARTLATQEHTRTLEQLRERVVRLENRVGR